MLCQLSYAGISCFVLKISLAHKYIVYTYLRKIQLTCVSCMSRMIRYHIETLVRVMAESIGKSGALGATPASTRFTPSMATMAPLSVQSLI